jgi:1-phosphofructokinase
MTMIYTLTLNPAVDYILRIPALTEGATNRATSATVRFGGKGINVSLVLRELGEETTALGFAAGFTGEALETELNRFGVLTDFVRLSEGMTRINVKLGTHAAETEINAPGPAVPAEALEALLDKLDRLGEGDTLVLAGSVPPSLPRDLYGRILKRLDDRGIRFVVDAEGETLTATLPFRPFLIKPNRAELEALVGHPLPTEEALKSAAFSLCEAGARNVLISLGGDGALLLDEYGGLHAAPAANIRPVSTVGAGDSMVAGFLAGVSHGYDYALKLGIAAGGATASVEGVAKREDILCLMTE